MRTVAFCEIDPYCQAVLRQHWPDVPVWDDIRELTVDDCGSVDNTRLLDRRSQEAVCSGRKTISVSSIDVICGGFPCQDISVAGKGAGIEGERSGLWSEYARIIGEVRPRYVIVENVAALLGRGIQRVLGDLATLGYDAEWHCIPASAVGAPHRRDRVWIIAYTRDEGFQGRGNAGTNGRHEGNKQAWLGPSIAHLLPGSDQWLTEPDVGRVAHGIPARVDRLRSLGNAIVPQMAEIIGKAIMLTD